MIPAMKKYRGLPTSQWPPSEWAALQARLSSRSRRDPNYRHDGDTAKLLVRLRSAYGCCLAWLQQQSPIDAGLTAAQRWPEHTIVRLVKDMHDRGYQPASTRARLECLRSVLARLDPGANLLHLTDEIDLLPRTAPRVPPAVLHVSTADLVKFGTAIMDDTYDADDLASSQKFRTGLQIAHLALRPWRAEAFSNIQIGSHLIRSGHGWRLVAPKAGSRLKRNASGDYPRRLLKYLERYLDHHRTVICGGAAGGNALWVIPNGRPFSKGLLHHYLTRATREHFGDALYPHAFRKCLTTTIAIDRPWMIHITPTALGHGPKVNEHWYNMAGFVSAFEQLESSIDAELREGNVRARQRRLRSADAHQTGKVGGYRLPEHRKQFRQELNPPLQCAIRRRIFQSLPMPHSSIGRELACGHGFRKIHIVDTGRSPQERDFRCRR